MVPTCKFPSLYKYSVCITVFTWLVHERTWFQRDFLLLQQKPLLNTVHSLLICRSMQAKVFTCSRVCILPCKKRVSRVLHCAESVPGFCQLKIKLYFWAPLAELHSCNRTSSWKYGGGYGSQNLRALNLELMIGLETKFCRLFRVGTCSRCPKSCLITWDSVRSQVPRTTTLKPFSINTECAVLRLDWTVVCLL